jgi:hypothetical protein
VAAEPEGKNVNSRNVKILAVVVLILFGTLFALNSGDRSDTSRGDELLFPELKSRLNDIKVVSITDAEGEIALRREADEDGNSPAGRWIAPDYDGYPVDTASLRRLLLAIADARKLEQKTSDPELYERLGVQDPRESEGDSSGVLVSAGGDNAAIALILGDTAQGEFRYARIPDQAPSWLINQNPALPADRAGWLLPGIVDIDASRIESAVIRHTDGEVVTIRKANADEVNFDVENIPEGRELRYPSVANSIGAVLGNLTLEDVRRADSSAQAAAISTAEFRTFDGLELLLRVHSRAAGDPEGENADTASDGNGDSDGDSDSDTGQHWITLKATAAPVPADDAPQESAEDADAAADTDDAAEAAAEETTNPVDEAAGINNRVSGWTYRIADYKADQLTRRQEDLLSDTADDATD